MPETRRLLLVCSRCRTVQNRRVLEDAPLWCPGCGGQDLEVREVYP